jgi:hypothetical protein
MPPANVDGNCEQAFTGTVLKPLLKKFLPSSLLAVA